MTPSEDGISVYFHDITVARAGRARARGGAAADRRGDRPPADPQRRERAAGGDARGRRAAAHPRRRRPQRLRRRPRASRSTSSDDVPGRRRPSTRTPRAAEQLRALRRRAAGGRPLRHAHRASLGELVGRAGGPRRTSPAMALPLISRGRTLGAAVVIGAVESALDRRVLVELAARAGVALDNAVLFGAERRLALTLQRSLLPTALPQLHGIELAARYLPGRRRAGRRRRLLPRPPARRRPPAADDRRRHGPRPAGRGPHGPAARGPDRLRLRRRPARPRPGARLRRARRRCWTCRWRPRWRRSTTRSRGG